MVKRVSLLFFVGFLFAHVTAYAAEQRGQPPRPAVKCVIRDLDVKPGMLHKDDRIESFTVDYRCEHGDRRGADIEIVLIGGADGRAIIAVLRDTTLKEGNHSITLKGTGQFFGSAGRFVTTLKGGSGVELHQRESTLNCLEWSIQNVSTWGDKGECYIRDLHVQPSVLKNGTPIQSFKVDHTCKSSGRKSDIEVKIGSGARYETIAILRDVVLPKGDHSSTLRGTGNFKGQGGNFEASLRGSWGSDRYNPPIRCSGWGIK